MVAVIKTGHSIRRIFNYNEQKVKEGVAECIEAVNYPKDVADLSLTNKLNRLLKQAALNENVSRNSVHISLNFDPSEKLQQEQLKAISASYMNGIGFDKQPYLVYQHHDAGHPHIHIISVKIKADGRRIDTQNIGRNQSEKARKEIEKIFHLKKAEHSKKSQTYELKPINVQRIKYGRSASKRAMTNVLDKVLKEYKYTSLPELNAVLRQYNMIADRGSEKSRVYKNKGLVYRILDGKGNKIGVPIKASDFYDRPTLNFLQVRFHQNKITRQSYKKSIKNAIDLALIKRPDHSLKSLIKALEKDGVNTVLRQNASGIIYGITYVDHRSKTVFNGSALGKEYSAKAIQERCDYHKERILKTEAKLFAKAPLAPQVFNPKLNANDVKQRTNFITELSRMNSATGKILHILLQPEYADYVPYQLKRKSKKKKRKHISNHL